MPIAINGSGTVTGISVGGLPDGIVDTDMLAAKAATTSKIGNGGIIAMSYGFRTGHLQTTSTSYVDSGITANITPSSSSNKVLIQMNPLMGLNHPSGQDVLAQVRILRDSTEIFTERTADYMRYMIGAGNTDYMIAGQFLLHQDSPSTTSQITYKLQVRTGGAGTLSCWAGSGIVLQEVVA